MAANQKAKNRIKVIEDNDRIRLRNWSNPMIWSEGEISFLSGLPKVNTQFEPEDWIMKIRSKADKMLRWIQWGGITIAVVMTVLTITIRHRQYKTELEQVRKNTRLEITMAKDQIQKYLQNIHTILRFISLDDEVKAMTRDSHDYIKAIYEDTYESYLLSEIYVIKRDFDGTHPPFMTFEHGDEEQTAEEMHDLESEEWEYKIQIEHIRRFARNPALEAQISSPGELCVDKTGIVYSVPIRSQDQLVGIVAGMIPEENISEILETIGFHERAILVNEQGDTFACKDMDDDTKAWCQSQLEMQEIKEFAKRNKEFKLGKYQIIAAEINTHDGQEWYLAFMYDDEVHLQANGFLGILSRYSISAMLFLLGVTATFLCRNLYKRLMIEENLRQSKEETEKINEQLEKETFVLRQTEKQLQQRDRALLEINRQLGKQRLQKEQANLRLLSKNFSTQISRFRILCILLHTTSENRYEKYPHLPSL